MMMDLPALREGSGGVGAGGGSGGCGSGGGGDGSRFAIVVIWWLGCPKKLNFVFSKRSCHAPFLEAKASAW